NPWGIYDMQGNLYEWCYDWYGDYKSNDKADPIGNTCGNMKTIRGGSWKYVWHESRSTSRGHFIPSYCHEDTGFRPVIICRVPQKQQ
ncbi:MAG: SUMF1/EgtB/PvdO family nonheme iron enzyme, partial [Thermoguttaceae bacterium]|nr:SUMF1/EgtB/PvdO family nonheme iron enzyme [Thermoguttaceae bacterium]